MTKVYITESGYKLNVASTLRMTASEAETLLDGVFEPALGNPDADGYVLSSTAAGVRSWVEGGGGASDVDDLATSTGSSTNMLRVAAAGGLEYRTAAQVLSDIGAAPTASPTFTGTVTAPTIVGGVIKPASDSATALQLANAAGTAVLTVDTTNQLINGLRLFASSENVVVGPEAGGSLTSAVSNFFAGSQAGSAVTSGSYNMAMGRRALKNLTTGSLNVAVGQSALRDTVTGAANVAIGGSAGEATTGSANTFIGTNAGLLNTTGSSNIAIGVDQRLAAGVSNRLLIGNNTTLSILDGIMSTTVAASSLKINGLVGLGTNATPTAYADIAASTTAAASLRIRSGTAPTSPNDGDIWFDGTNLKMYDGTTTRTIFWT